MTSPLLHNFLARGVTHTLHPPRIMRCSDPHVYCRNSNTFGIAIRPDTEEDISLHDTQLPGNLRRIERWEKTLAFARIRCDGAADYVMVHYSS